ncbi:MAG: cytochrome-c oxidase, cbb3-type subunit III [Micavibrio aeruginosavorus]|uniref:Cytochrome c oxidase subunit III n=1 Tax=Micavibrio aeruginosavorus TaxID=349221 RepID=A0A7T5UGD6_9BACT|nr:MAG: cytochrome-c oxidase, cbb3-type subunit III [Micavibrio aeruginosavorus]
MTDHHNKKEIDDISGVETTGHEWDGLKELNNPAPRWWLWVFYVTVIWSVGYWVIYPAWPTPGGATKGTSGWTQFTKLKNEQAEIFERQGAYLNRFHNSSFEEIMNDPELYAFANAGGAAVFKDNCATCHGTGGAGGKGYPNLNDDEWLWGGRIENIYQTLQYGIRSSHEETRVSQMPSFGRDGLLTRTQVTTVTDYVRGLSSGKSGSDHPGHAIFQEKCASCHGPDAKGGREFGAPNLTDAIWLYGESKDTIFKTVYDGRAGMMPHWKGRLNDDTLRQLTIYVHSLGGGEKSESVNDSEFGPITPGSEQ